ncbi:MAG: pyrroline-5-carboxylate reductase [Alphaproteobacteria bacterium]
MEDPDFLIVGAGRMGGALLSGWIKGRRKAMRPEQLTIIDPSPSEAALTAIENGAVYLKNPDASLRTVSCVLLAIKPQMFDVLAPALAAHLPKGCLIISILAGTTMTSLRAIFPEQAIIRAMPNTPASIGAGITAFTCAPDVSDEQRVLARKLLSAGGKVHEVANEHLIDVVTAVSGSGPAYIFHMVEALQVAAISNGMPEDIAPDFARQTIIGAGALLKESPLSATELRQAVTSPNGTTQAALDVLMSAEGLPPLMRETVSAALKRAKELGQG